MKRWLGIGGGIAGILLVILGFVMKNQTVSVIGGADGPTSIFIVGKTGGNLFYIVIAIGVILIAAAMIALVLERKR